MLKRLHLGCLLILLPVLAGAQTSMSFQESDSSSYSAYLKGNWKEVRAITNQSLKTGYDYFYLRMRAGIAESQMNHPARAIVHFQKALFFNSSDPYALGYYYNSLLKAGYKGEARLLSTSLSETDHKLSGIPTKRLIESAFVEGGYMFNPKNKEMLAYSPDAELALYYQIPDYQYVSAGLVFTPGKRFTGTACFTTLNFPAVQQFTLGTQPPLNFEVPFVQRGIYLSGSYYAAKGLWLGLSGHFLDYTMMLAEYPSDPFSTQTVFDVYRYQDYAINLSLSRQTPYLSMTLSGDYNRIRDSLYLQAGANLVIYPWGNTDTWAQGTYTWVRNSLNPAGRSVAQVKIGHRLIRKIWLEGYYSFGTIRNFSENQAYIVYNNFDPITARVGVNLIAYGVTRNLDLTIRYNWSRRTASWTLYKDFEPIGSEQIPYPIHSLIGGILWRF